MLVRQDPIFRPISTNSRKGCQYSGVLTANVPLEACDFGMTPFALWTKYERTLSCRTLASEWCHTQLFRAKITAKAAGFLVIRFPTER